MNAGDTTQRKGGWLDQRVSSRAGDSIQKPVILSEAEEPLASAGSGGAELSRSPATSAREKLEVLRLRSLPPSPAGNSAQNDNYFDAPLRGIIAPHCNKGVSSRTGDSIQKPVILSEAEEPLASAGSGGAELSRSPATSAREKLEVLRLRSLPPSPAGNSAQNDSLYDAPLRGFSAVGLIFYMLFVQ